MLIVKWICKAISVHYNKIIVRQRSQFGCGHACLEMVFRYFNIKYTSHLDSNHPLSMLLIKRTLEKADFCVFALSIERKQLGALIKSNIAILHWNENHFVVLFKTFRFFKNEYYVIGDPCKGLTLINSVEFDKCWVTQNKNSGILLLINQS